NVFNDNVESSYMWTKLFLHVDNHECSSFAMQKFQFVHMRSTTVSGIVSIRRKLPAFLPSSAKALYCNGGSSHRREIKEKSHATNHVELLLDLQVQFALRLL